MRRDRAFLAALASALACSPAQAQQATIAVAPVTATPLLDGRCGDSEWTGAARTPLGNGVTLLAQDNGAAVQLCLLLPPDSLGTYDLYLEDGAGKLHNFHSSAQVGERTFANGAWPDWSWGNHGGWYGPPVPFRGLGTRPDGRPTTVFASEPSRELEIRKARFGLGKHWRMMIQVRALGPDRSGSVTFPATAKPEMPESWGQASVG
jgi:hypothetical protein